MTSRPAGNAASRSYRRRTLAGNRNVVRVSSRSAGAADAVLTALNAALADVDEDTAEAISSTQRMITYGHDDEVSTALSAACDLRVIWGGDASVRAIRRYPLGPAARDLTFPDRASFAALSVPGWQAASDDERRAAVTGFYGQNVPYPGFGREWGFVVSVLILLGSAALLWLMFKKRDWL